MRSFIRAKCPFINAGDLPHYVECRDVFILFTCFTAYAVIIRCATLAVIGHDGKCQGEGAMSVAASRIRR